MICVLLPLLRPIPSWYSVMFYKFQLDMRCRGTIVLISSFSLSMLRGHYVGCSDDSFIDMLCPCKCVSILRFPTRRVLNSKFGFTSVSMYSIEQCVGHTLRVVLLGVANPDLFARISILQHLKHWKFYLITHYLRFAELFRYAHMQKFMWIRGQLAAATFSI